ncbi:GNAT family N-acetyltransferase [Pseudoruegeria sp. HB172150]|uniref:GNAT family N-acetyltransferase n=1 Tax=Pseudoruegeria sp. HB172150 TaxID=2721164 RepID=UPI0015516437|nr:GNAT family N-acetyltransferase [Pseudoruegeria sp. HB172150]
MNEIRQAKPEDAEALYAICLKTGDAGEDATHLYSEPRLIGHIYAGPYLACAPELAFVAERDGMVVGYCVGAADSRAFAVTLERDWWPALRETYPKPDPARQDDWTADERRCQMIHDREPTPDAVVSRYPAHLHMNLLPAAQGQGLGGQLLERWVHAATALGVTGAHVGASAGNARGIRFWQKQGFEKIATPGARAVWMGRRLQDQP